MNAPFGMCETHVKTGIFSTKLDWLVRFFFPNQQMISRCAPLPGRKMGLSYNPSKWCAVTPTYLGGGFKYFLFSPLFGEDFQFDEHIFQMG